jgi:hypothetical protein
MSADAIAAADELCEILHRPDWAAHGGELPGILAESASLDATVVEVARRGFLERLLPDGDGSALWPVLLGVAGAEASLALAVALIERGRAEDAEALGQLALGADARGALTSVLAGIIAAGRYDALLPLVRQNDAALEALARARPDYGADALNQAALARLRAGTTGQYGLLIVPGYTPLGSTQPTHVADIEPARQRLETALNDLSRGVAPCILVSGGAVHPPGTPVNEALEMRQYLVARGVAPEQLLVDPYARHSTTNLRNAGRLMRAAGVTTGLIATGYESETFDQAFYFAHPILSTYAQRCRAELGYLVGQLDGIDEHHIAFKPAPEVDRLDPRDPIDA